MCIFVNQIETFHKQNKKVNLALIKTNRSRNYKNDVKQNSKANVQYFIFKTNLDCNSANSGLAIVFQDTTDSPCSKSTPNLVMAKNPPIPIPARLNGKLQEISLILDSN